MLKPGYIEGSVWGTILDPQFNRSFNVTFEGVIEPGDHRADPACLPAVLRQPANGPAGRINVHVQMPNASHGKCEIAMALDISTDILGVSKPREIREDEIAAILSHWDELKEAALADEVSTGDAGGLEDLKETFARVEALAGAATFRMHRNDTRFGAPMMVSPARYN